MARDCSAESSVVFILRLPEVARARFVVAGGGGELGVRFEDEVIEIGVSGSRRAEVGLGTSGGGNGRGWWRVETIVEDFTSALLICAPLLLLLQCNYDPDPTD